MTHFIFRVNIMILIPLLVSIWIIQANAASIPLRSGLIITSSVRISKQVYRLPGPASLDSSVITIRGDNITVDFAGATMEGIDPTSDPDLDSAVAIRIDGGKNIRILHAHIRGYKIGILARNTRNL